MIEAIVIEAIAIEAIVMIVMIETFAEVVAKIEIFLKTLKKLISKWLVRSTLLADLVWVNCST